ncbi:MAG TPA: glycoside hydrolase family 2 TIM barrel-domain containing protein [Chloroflexota bacterium]|nr:glycoside hydrolase family 2 TIM barrel-domain containing protein [Chloroflexota bacterium]
MASSSGRTRRPLAIRQFHLPHRSPGGWRRCLPPRRWSFAALPSPLPALLVASLAYLLLRPLLALLHSVVVLGVAAGLHGLATSGAVAWLASNGPADPVYKSVMLWTLTGIEPVGLAVHDPLGSWLAAVYPAVFAPPALLPGNAWVGAVVSDGATLLAQLAARLVGHLALLAVGGLVLLGSGYRPRHGLRPGWRAILAALVLLQGGLGLVRVVLSLSPHEIEILGLAQVLSKLFHWSPAEYRALLPRLPLLALEGATLVLLALVALLAGRRIVSGLRGHPRSAATAAPHARPATQVQLARGTMVAVWLGCALLAPPHGLAEDEPMYEAPVTTVTTDVVPDAAAPVAAAGPSVVTIEGEPFHYVYKVNGARQVLRGIGYNVPYASRSREWRAKRYDRDFAMMQAAQFNTLIGWDENEFDDLTLDKAQQYGLGVIWPYNLPPDGDYADPAYCAAQRARVLDFVARYASHPALRMWGLGNEVLHDMPEQDHAARAQAFAACYADLVAAVHAADPNHPIIYRDSEDVWLDPVRDALVNRGLDQPWMVYGANIFTFRLRDLVAGWPDRGLKVPLVISEYGPTGYAPADRPGALVAMWNIIRQKRARDYVLGGSIYGWTTDGIEAIDRVYGLTNADGQPVDGALAAIARRFAASTGRPCELAACAAASAAAAAAAPH